MIAAGPYGEEELFLSQYECKNANIYELFLCLDNNIKNKKTYKRELSRVGDYFISF